MPSHEPLLPACVELFRPVRGLRRKAAGNQPLARLATHLAAPTGRKDAAAQESRRARFLHGGKQPPPWHPSI